MALLECVCIIINGGPNNATTALLSINPGIYSLVPVMAAGYIKHYVKSNSVNLLRRYSEVIKVAVKSFRFEGLGKAVKLIREYIKLHTTTRSELCSNACR